MNKVLFSIIALLSFSFYMVGSEGQRPPKRFCCYLRPLESPTTDPDFFDLGLSGFEFAQTKGIVRFGFESSKKDFSKDRQLTCVGLLILERLKDKEKCCQLIFDFAGIELS